MIKQITVVEIIERVKTLKLNEWINIAMNFTEGETEKENEAEQWIEIKYLEIMDSECIIIGGYGYDLKVLLNKWEWEKKKKNDEYIIEKLEKDIINFIESQLGFYKLATDTEMECY